MGIDPFQAEVARIALEVAAEHGFALAGGNALVAHGITHRPTEDVDLFTPTPGGPGLAADLVRARLEQAGYQVRIVRPPEVSQGEFARLEVTDGEQTMLLDLGQEWRERSPVSLDVGPVLHLDDVVGSKVTAMVGRGLPRDFIDVGSVLGRYSRAELMRLAFVRDPGLRVVDFTNAVAELDGIPAAAFFPYGLDEAAVAELREGFALWPRDAAHDDEGHAVHASAVTETHDGS